ncbi:MAG: hypothetical protein CSA61_01375 [Neptuniibacter caesariensis]|uniref:Uncharacterized protein n=1 Tax=Neptuniibacter caesariensis TaxID=207954 RepID=A0A2G6JAW1_NEPCE|nr:MAG: hypothetical protein CSA61_01375 [Neptuniibacter caesariensis]
MNELDLYTFYVVLYEMMGILLWILVALALLAVGGFFYVFVREGKLQSRRLIVSEILGVLGGFVALFIMAKVTISGFTDAGGPVDWLLIGLIWGGGLVGVTLLSYAIMGFLNMLSDSPANAR